MKMEKNKKSQRLYSKCVGASKRMTSSSVCMHKSQLHITKQMLVGHFTSMGVQTILETKQNEVFKIIDPVSERKQSKGTNILFSAIE